MVYGYSYTKLVMEADNAEQHRIGFDGFEDYNYYDDVKSFGNCKAEYSYGDFEFPEGISLNNSNKKYPFISNEHRVILVNLALRSDSSAPVQMKRKNYSTLVCAKTGKSERVYFTTRGLCRLLYS
ncbi:MAG: hypothetical protein U5L09_15075 [Bacteroidales bacterium]|nr:hypothetical protein [Bacteroidales bacterium]